MKTLWQNWRTIRSVIIAALALALGIACVAGVITIATGGG